MNTLTEVRFSLRRTLPFLLALIMALRGTALAQSQDPPEHTVIKPGYLSVNDGLSSEDRWKQVLYNFPPLEQWTDQEKDQAKAHFENVPLPDIPPEWRYAFYFKKLHWFQLTGNWNGLLSMRDSLMAPSITDSTRPLIEADILFRIAYYFTTVVFPPPNSVGAVSMSSEPVTDEIMAEKLEHLNYWESNYKDYAKAEVIYEYILDHFPENYVVSQNALYALSGVKLRLDKPREAIDLLNRLETVDAEELIGAARFEAGRIAMLSAEQHLSIERTIFERNRANVPKRRFDAATDLEELEMIQEFLHLIDKYPDNMAVQRGIRKRLTGTDSAEASAAENRALILRK